MARKFCSLAFFAVVLGLPGLPCLGQEVLSHVQKQQERYTLSLDLEFSRKSGNPLEGTLFR